MGDILMLNRKALAVASGKPDSDQWPIALAVFSVSGIIELNRDLIADFGGSFLGADNLRENCKGRLEYTVNMVSNGDEYLPDDHYYRAAWLWERLVMSHLFNDGNKRVALAAMLVYLETRDIVLYMPAHLVDRLQRQIVSKSVSIDDIARQLRKCR